MSMRTLLEEEAKSELGELAKLQVGSQEYETAVNGIVKLVDKVVDMDKFDAELDDKIGAREIENQLKEKQAKSEARDRIVKNVLTGVGTIGGFTLTIWGALKSWKFEETGTVTTSAGKSFLSRLIPKK